MTPEKLKQILDKKFQVVGFADLADLTASPVAAFKFFKDMYQPQFDPNQRIVVYTSEPLSNDVLKHLYRTVNFIDISNWFLLICTPNDIQTQLIDVCSTSSSDTVPFQNLVLPLTNSNRLGTNFDMPDTICAIPWMNIEIRSGGEIGPCCMSSYKFGQIGQDKLVDIFHGNDMKKLRQQLLNGEKPPGCNLCWDKEQQGLSSIRQHNIKRLKVPFMTKYFEDPQISTLDIKFQNTCNFKCRICNPTSSSLFADEQSKQFGIKIIPPVKWSENKEFIDQMNQLLPDLHNIDMYGGEPFLIKKFSSVLKTAVESGASKHIRLHYHSNGSVWPDNFIEYWPHFREVDIHFSIDAIGERFELQRGGNWKDVEQNMLRIKNLNLPNLNISIMPTVSVMSVLYIDDVIEWAHQHQFQIFWSHVTNPKEFSLASMTQAAKDLVLTKHAHNQWPELQEILASIASSPASDGRAFCEKTQWFDRVRGENFSNSHPEIAKAMGYVYNSNND